MMAYNYYYGGYPYQANFGAMPDNLNQFKNSYYPQMSPPQLIPQPMPNGTSNDMIWVLGEVEAMSYPVAPNNTVVLWDKNNNTIYIKSVNAQGVPSMRTLDFFERTSEKSSAPNESQNIRFVCVEEFKALEAKFEELNSEFSNISTKLKSKVQKSAKEEEENGIDDIAINGKNQHCFSSRYTVFVEINTDNRVVVFLDNYLNLASDKSAIKLCLCCNCCFANCYAGDSALGCYGSDC